MVRRRRVRSSLPLPASSSDGRASVIPEPLMTLECGFGYFAGDVIRYKDKEGTKTAEVVFVSRSMCNLQTQVYRCDGKKYTFDDFFLDMVRIGDPTLKRLNVPRKSPRLFPKITLRQIYEQYSLNGKVFFLYHYYGCGRVAAEKTATRLQIDLAQVRSVLKKARSRNLL